MKTTTTTTTIATDNTNTNTNANTTTNCDYDIHSKIRNRIMYTFPRLAREVLSDCNIKSLDYKVCSTNEPIKEYLDNKNILVAGAAIVNPNYVYNPNCGESAIQFVFFNTTTIARMLDMLTMGTYTNTTIGEVVRYYINHELTHVKQFITDYEKYGCGIEFGVPLREREADEYAMSKAEDKDIAMLLANSNANVYGENYDLLGTVKSSMKMTFRSIIRKISK